jgi:hypothetical protein
MGFCFLPRKGYLYLTGKFLNTSASVRLDQTYKMAGSPDGDPATSKSTLRIVRAVHTRAGPKLECTSMLNCAEIEDCCINFQIRVRLVIDSKISR